MGNVTSECVNSLCDLSFLRVSNDLRKTSLQIKKISLHSPVKNDQAMKEIIPLNRGESSLRDLELESPTARRGSNKEEARTSEEEGMNENNFAILKVLREDSNGKLYLVSKHDEDMRYAMRVINKKQLNDEEIREALITQRQILNKANHPFIITLYYQFENDKNRFFVTEYLEGGKLSTVLKQLTRFSEEITRFYCAEILLALEYLHKEINVMYRNLQPKNILLDEQGHIRVTEFGLSKKLVGNESSAMVGTPEYMAPEMVNERKYQRTVDYWSFGCLVYELLTGRPPFYDPEQRREIIFEKILKNEITWPDYLSKNARDLIYRLILPKSEERLGYNDINEIKTHPFFFGVKWDKVYSKSVYPPLDPLQFRRGSTHHEDDDFCYENCTLSRILEDDEITESDDLRVGSLKRKSLIIGSIQVT